jgi:hypothetical protein
MDRQETESILGAGLSKEADQAESFHSWLPYIRKLTLPSKGLYKHKKYVE